MKQEIRDKWVEALRSNTYQQGIGKLENEGKYCCMGVLGEVLNYTIKEDGCEFREDDDNYFKEEFEDINYPILQIEHGIDSNQQGVFIDMNDLERLSFPEIADYIEKNIPITE